jgi:hypothetical protein
MVVFDADEVSAQTRPKKVRKKRKRKRRRSRRPTSFIGARLGGILTAPGELSVGNNTSKFDDESGAGINGLAVFAIQSNIRAGLSIWLFPDFTAESRGTDIDGSMVQLNGQGEFVIPVSRQVEGFGFAEAGVAILNNDDSDQGDFLGFNAGIGIGGQFLVSRSVAIRGEGKFEFYNVSNNEDDEVTLNAQRVMLNIGVLFGI